MKRILSICCLLLFCAGMTFAQRDYYDDDESYEEDDDFGDDNDDYYDEDQKEHEENDDIAYIFNRTRAGDQMIKISIALTVPTDFGNPFPGGSGKLKIGGLGSIGYHYFLTDWFALGADIGFGFNSSIGENLFNHVPIVFSATFQPSFKNFEFPISLGVGLAWETYNKYTYWPGLVIKPEVGAHYKLSQSWSVGADVSYTILPQFGKIWGTGDKNRYARFLTIAVSARFYF